MSRKLEKRGKSKVTKHLDQLFVHVGKEAQVF